MLTTCRTLFGKERCPQKEKSKILFCPWTKGINKDSLRDQEKRGNEPSQAKPNQTKPNQTKPNMMMKFPPFTTFVLLSLFHQPTRNVNGEDLGVPEIGVSDDTGYTMCAEEESGLGYQWIDINEPSTAGDIKGTHSLGFNFPFYGMEYNKFRGSTTGHVFFDPSYVESWEGFSQCGLPTSATYAGSMPPEFIAVFNQPLGVNYADYEPYLCFDERFNEYDPSGNPKYPSGNRELQSEIKGGDHGNPDDFHKESQQEPQPESQQEAQLESQEEEEEYRGLYHYGDDYYTGYGDDYYEYPDPTLSPTAPTTAAPTWCNYEPVNPTTSFHVKNFDACPIGSGKCTVLQWHNLTRDYVCTYDSSIGTVRAVDSLQFEAVLFENGDIHFQYNTTANYDAMPDAENGPNDCHCGSSHPTGEHTVVGIQGSPNPSPIQALEYTCLTKDLYPGLAVSFQAPGNQGTACKTPTVETNMPSPAPSSSHQPTSSICTEQGLDIACVFNDQDQENKGFTTLCVKNIEPDTGYIRYRNTCKRNDVIAGIIPGDIVPTMEDDSVLVGCGCCDRCGVQDDTHNKQYGEYAKYCNPAVCTPESDPENWEVCDAWGNGIVKTIKVCIIHEDGIEEEVCADPFLIPEKATDVVQCGACTSAA